MLLATKPAMSSLSSIFISFVTLIAVTQALELAIPAVQQKRASYNGGWAMGIPGASCPSYAPTMCNAGSSSINPTCCPSGQTCMGYFNPYCCPTGKFFTQFSFNFSAADCVNVVTNFPVCANSTWDMYSQGGTDYFCCPPGQFGVLPLRGWAGICEPLDQAVASSLIATIASQVGAVAPTTNLNTGGNVGVPTSTVVVTSTLRGGGVTTITTAVSNTGITSTATQTATSTGATASGTSSAGSSGSSGGGGNSGSTTSKTKKLSTGAVVGIAIAAFLVLVALMVFFQRWIARRKSKPAAAMESGYEAGPANGPPPGYGGAAPAMGMLDANNTGGGGGGGYKTPISAVSAVSAHSTGGGGYGQQGQGYGQQGGWNSGTPPVGGQGPYGPPPIQQQQQQYGPPPGLAEVPGRWEGRAEMGSGIGVGGVGAGRP